MRSSHSRKGRVSSLPFFFRPGRRVPCAVTVAGSDSSAGAGIQADLKVFSAFGIYGMCAVTAVTAQNPEGVRGVRPLPPSFVRLQMETVLSGTGAEGIKTGMLCSAETVRAVSSILRLRHPRFLVVDPVMVSTSGHPLLAKNAVEALKRELLPLADLVTPNLPEAEKLSKMGISGENDMRRAAEKIFRLGPKAVLIKGGHLQGDAVDLLFDGTRMTRFSGKRILTRHTHGTGCMLSAAILANLILRKSLIESVEIGKDFMNSVIRKAVPLNPLFGRWKA
jgi:hydroxymethylpyrimidine/phosphomethylpyrimidine kinase